MNLLDILNHLFSFAAPALFLAILMHLVARLVFGKKAASWPWWVQVLIHGLVGIGVLAGGIWWLERDGRVLTYAALVLMAATTQWVLSRSWRK
jgi:hypothetical protein